MRAIEDIVSYLEDILSKEDFYVLQGYLKPIMSLSKYARVNNINMKKLCISQNISMAELNDMYQESINSFDEFVRMS